MMGPSKNHVHHDNIWRNHCEGEVHCNKTWSSKWGFYNQELHRLKAEQQKMSSVRPTNYALSFDPALKPRRDSKDQTKLKLPPIQPTTRKLEKPGSTQLPPIAPLRSAPQSSAASAMSSASTHSLPDAVPQAHCRHHQRRQNNSSKQGDVHRQYQEHIQGRQPSKAPLALSSRCVGARALEPLEKYGAYCRGKMTAEKTLGWPRQ